ncbi:MAG: acetate--CoA ligase family protein [Promethearchaeati archaeon SRVP18_Atabeyarchaeia-1]
MPANSVEKIIHNALSDGRTFLLEPESKEVVGAYGMPVTKFKVAKSVEEAVKFSSEIGYPVVMKIVSPDVLHKSDAGAVKVNLKNGNEVRAAFAEISENVKRFKSNAKVVGYIVEQLAPPGNEVIVGMAKDPQFGPALMFGLGGIFVEVLKDVSFRIAPLTEYDAREMIQEIKGYPVLTGIRGQKPADVNSLVDIILKVSKLVTEHAEIEQLDLNPIFVYEKGARIVDARIILSTDGEKSSA